MKYDVENILKQHMPSLLDLLGEQRISWTSVNRQLEKHIIAIREEYKLTQTIIRKDANFHTIIKNKIIGNCQSDGMFDFYNKLFSSLNKILTKEEKKPIHRIVKSILTETNKDYLNFIGELATLNKFMQTGEYNLGNIEEVIHSDQKITADILLQRKVDKIEVLIEVLNLHLEIKEFENFESLECYLTSKFNKKISDKKLLDTNKIIFIQPVVWTIDDKQLKFICEFYSNTHFKIDKVITPMSYITYKNINGDYEHRFESIRTIMVD